MLETLIGHCCEIIGKLPWECCQYTFMQMALLAMLITAPLTAAAGVQVINYRMAFFADAISHSAFAGAALGILFCGANAPLWSMPLLAVLIGLGIMYLKQSGKLSGDTVIGVFFAFTVSLGLLLTSKEASLAKLSQNFIFGDILTVTPQDICFLFILLVIYAIFITFAYNPLLQIAIDEEIPQAHRVRFKLCNYLHIMLLALIVISCVKSIGVLLVSAMLIVPAATARNLAKSAGSTFLYAVITGLIAGIAGLFIAVQEWANTAAGAAVVMINCIIFAFSIAVKRLFRQ